VIDSGESDIDNFDVGKNFPAPPSVSTRGLQQTGALQTSLDSSRRERPIEVRVGRDPPVMADRAYGEFTLERSEYGFDLSQRHVERHSTLDLGS